MANSKKALDENGVLYLWGKVKTYVATAIANIKLPSKTSANRCGTVCKIF